MRTLPKRRRINATERLGVNYVASLFEEANCIFREIHREHDYGHDAVVQLVDGEQVIPMELALQIKSGSSYCTSRRCSFPVNSQHLTYWREHPLHTYGIVYDPDEGVAYWIDLKAEAQELIHSDVRRVQFPKAEWNRLDRASFHNIFLPPLLGRPPNIDLVTSMRWAESCDYTLHDWGVHHLLHCHRDSPRAWSTFFRVFRYRPIEETTPYLIYALAHLPGHYDIVRYFGSGVVQAQIRKDGLKVISSFDRSQVIKLLEFMDDYGFERASLGQNVGAIISAIDNWESILGEIVSDHALDVAIRERAAYLLEHGIGYPMRPRGYDLNFRT